MTWPIEPVLNALDIPYNPSRSGNQPIHCPNPAHDDAHSSASLNLGKGLFNCLACGAGGSGVDLLMLVKGMELADALREQEALASGDSREIPREPERSSVGLPGRPGRDRRTMRPIPAWRGFRT